MGVQLALLAYSDQGRINTSRPVDDFTPCDEIIQRLFPRTPLVRSETVTLLELGIPDRGLVAAAAFERGVLLSARDAHLYNPSKLHARYLKPSTDSTVQLFTQRSYNDMFAYARWSRGRLIRSISVNPVGRIWESIGPPEPFESPFWAGSRAVDDYPLPFHPLDMSNAALASELNLCGDAADELPGMAHLDGIVLTIYQRRGRWSQNVPTNRPKPP